MRSVTFQSVLDGAAARIGLDPTQTIQPSTASALTEYINTRTRFAWEAYKWPELSAIEKRQFRPTFDAAATYASGAEVFYLGNYYRKTGTGAVGVLPTVTATWTSAATLTDFVRSIDFDQAFTAASGSTKATPIGEVMHVYRQDPRVVRYAERVNFWVTDSGAIVGPTQFTNATPNEVYVEFTIRPTMFNTSSNDADFPRVISEYVKFSAAADALREDGQFDKASYMDGLAADALQKEMDIIELKQGQTRLQGNRRDLFPSTPMQRASSSPVASALDKATSQAR
jgi:hypothetical protein